MKQDNTLPNITIGLSIVAVLSLVVWVSYSIWRSAPTRETQRLVAQSAVTFQDDLPNDATLNQLDAWGHPLKFKRHATDVEVSQTVTSAGEDGQFGTKDDITYTDIDYNKSRLVGRWLGEKSKEVVKGFTDEVTTRFDRFSPPEVEAEPRQSLKDKIKGLWNEAPATRKSNER